MLTALRAGQPSIDVDVKRHLINTAVLSVTLDGGINTVIYNLFLLRLGYGPELVGTINAVGMIVFALACLPVGRLSDVVGVRRMLRLGMVVIVIGSALVPAAGLLPVSLQTFVLILSAAITNIGMAGYFVCTVPYLGAITSPEQRTAAFSAQSATVAIFGFGGSLLGGNLPPLLSSLGVGELSQPGPYQTTLWLIPLMLIVPMIMLARMRNVVSQDDVALAGQSGSLVSSGAVPVKSTLALLAFFGAVRFLQVGGVGAVQTFFNVYMDSQLHVSTATIGAIQAVSKLSGLPAALAIPWLTRKLGGAGAVICALLIAAAGMLPLAWIAVPAVASVGYILVWLSTPVRYAAYMVYVMSRTPRRLHGTLNGMQEGLAGFGFASIAFFGGFTVVQFGYSLLFTVGAIAMILSAIMLGAYAFGSRLRSNPATLGAPPDVF